MNSVQNQKCGAAVIITALYNKVMEIWKQKVKKAKSLKIASEETELLELWSRIHYEAEKRHETQLNALIDRSILSKRRFRKRGSYYSRKEKRDRGWGKYP